MNTGAVGAGGGEVLHLRPSAFAPTVIVAGAKGDARILPGRHLAVGGGLLALPPSVTAKTSPFASPRTNRADEIAVLRRRILASGVPLLTEREINERVSELRRG